MERSLLHPLSPKGKLIHWGREGLQATNRLIHEACQAQQRQQQLGGQSSSDCNFILCDEILRLAFTPQQEQQLKATASSLPDLCTWLDGLQASELLHVRAKQQSPPPQPLQLSSSSLLSSEPVKSNQDTDAPPPSVPRGALILSNGCKTIHVPSYLQSLWLACQQLFTTHDEKETLSGGTATATWLCIQDDSREAWKQRLSQFDTVVLAAGSGLFESTTAATTSRADEDCHCLLSRKNLGVQLVRGQSLILRTSNDDNGDTQPATTPWKRHALLNGKYVSSLPQKDLVLVGATHEFQSTSFSQSQVLADLKSRTYEMIPDLWKDMEDENGNVSLEAVTVGTRVQTPRGAHGRRPIIGKLPNHTSGDENGQIHPNTWIFTGLSSRGLIHHALYGEILARAILENNEELIVQRDMELLWWKRH